MTWLARHQTPTNSYQPLVLLHFDGIQNSSYFYDATGNTEWTEWGWTATNNPAAAPAGFTGAYQSPGIYGSYGKGAVYCSDYRLVNLFGSGLNWTIQFLMNPQAWPSSSTADTIVGMTNTTAGFTINQTYTGSIVVDLGAAGNLNSVSTPAIGIWTHVAVVRNGGTFTLFINGINENSFIEVSDPTTSLSVGNAFLLGCNDTTELGGGLEGLISEFRIDPISLYTANFTPPSSPYSPPSPPIPNPNLLALVHFDRAAIVDEAGVAVSTERYNNSGFTNTMSKFGTGCFAGNGSAYFALWDPAPFGDLPGYLLSPQVVGDFTFELWLYGLPSWGGASATPGLFGRRASSSAYGLISFIDPSTGFVNVWWATSSVPFAWAHQMISSISCINSAWNHVAYVRSGTNYYLFINGQIGATLTTSDRIRDDDSPWTVGSSDYNGNTTLTSGLYIDEFRFSGNAVYTAPFTPPTAPFLPAAQSGITDPYNVVLLHFDATNPIDIVDSTKLGTQILLFNGAQISSTQAKFGSSSFAGQKVIATPPSYAPCIWLSPGQNIDYFPDRTILAGSDFTIECWVYGLPSWNSGIAGQSGIFSKTPGGGYTVGMKAWVDQATGEINYWITNNSSSWTIQAATVGTLLNSAWNHFAMVRFGNIITVYINGVGEAPLAFTGQVLESSNLLGIYTAWMIGCVDSGILGSNALAQGMYIDEFRISLIARYTSNFTPPTSAFNT